MITKTTKISTLFEELSKKITKEVNIYLIGGAAMMYFERKDQTKDIDIVLATRDEYNEIIRAIEQSNFTSNIPTKEYSPFDLSQIYTRDDFRIDVFEKTVCKGFALTQTMQERAIHIYQNNTLNAYCCSPTDIFLFKTFTEREGDIDDCKALAKEEIQWNEMLKEIHTQIEIVQQPVWITYIGERLDILEETIHIPILKEIDKLRNKYYDELEEQLRKQANNL